MHVVANKGLVQALEIWVKTDEVKCKFFQTRLELLGHVVTPTEINLNEQKIDNILQAPMFQFSTHYISYYTKSNAESRFVKFQDTFANAKVLVSKSLQYWYITMLISLFSCIVMLPQMEWGLLDAHSGWS